MIFIKNVFTKIIVYSYKRIHLSLDLKIMNFKVYMIV